jgi:glycerol-3-phosphate dehydrogenase
MVKDFDVVIIGGWIKGCGTFRDLCLQGVKMLLLEREDFCSGALGGSSRLMHGGLKYPETGEFRLMRKSLTEPNTLLSTAPHYVRPSEVVLPVFGGLVTSALRFLGGKGKLTDRGILIAVLGLTVFDLYTRAWKAMPNLRMLRRGLRRLMPGLAPGITGAAVYDEGHLTHADRLGLDGGGNAREPGGQPCGPCGGRGGCDPLPWGAGSCGQGAGFGQCSRGQS